ncbi:MAG: molecular chaperone GroES [Candidatus Omnitrophica bacterium 4484_171]|nr:MAG: molecular chaperone GroES [Candidatus Omnitrophica bacterium 4484_171]
MVKIQPINNYVLIKLSKEAEEKTPAGIVIPDTAREKPKEGEVAGLAAGATDEIAVGDKVIYKDFSGTQITFEGEEYLLIPAGDILAKYAEVDSI